MATHGMNAPRIFHRHEDGLRVAAHFQERLNPPGLECGARVWVDDDALRHNNRRLKGHAAIVVSHVKNLSPPQTVVRLHGASGRDDATICDYDGRTRITLEHYDLLVATSALRRLPPRARPVALAADVVCRDGPRLLVLLCRAGLLSDVASHALSYLYIARVTPTDLAVRCVSSCQMAFPITELLNPRTDTWWTSMVRNSELPVGRGQQWVEIDCTRDKKPRRIEGVALRIPPMPQGPVAVRKFSVGWRRKWIGKGWRYDNVMMVRGPSFELLDQKGLQEFVLPEPVDACVVRITVESAATPDASCYGLLQACVF